MIKNIQLLQEALIVGIIIVVIGSIVSYIISKFNTHKMPPICKYWNKYHIMEICLFFTGFLGHLALEALGMNKWYCKYGRACIRKI